MQILFAVCACAHYRTHARINSLTRARRSYLSRSLNDVPHILAQGSDICVSQKYCSVFITASVGYVNSMCDFGTDIMRNKYVCMEEKVVKILVEQAS